MKPAFLTQIFFLLLAVAVASLAVWQYQKKSADEEEKQVNSLLFKNKFEKEDVLSFSMKRADGAWFELKNQDARWQVKTPLAEDFADPKKVYGLLTDLIDQEVTLVASQDINWTEYDLDPPFFVMKIQTKKTTFEAGIGHEASVDSKYFIKKENNLFLGDSRWNQLTRMLSSDYRSRALYHFNKRPVQIKINSKGLGLNFKYENHDWKWDGQKIYPLSSSAFEDFWTSLRQDFIIEFTNKKKSDFLKEKIWLNPVVEISMEILKEDQDSLNDQDLKTKPWSMKMVQGEESKFYLTTSDRDYIFELDDISAQKLIQPDFRDHKIPFKWKVGDLRKVEVKKDDLDILIKVQDDSNLKNLSSNIKVKDFLENTQWNVVQPQDHDLSDYHFNSLISWLARLSSKGYFDQEISQASAVLSLKNHQDQVMLKLTFGEVFQNEEDEEMIYVQTPGSKEVMAVEYKILRESLPSLVVSKDQQDSAEDLEENKQSPSKDPSQEDKKEAS